MTNISVNKPIKVYRGKSIESTHDIHIAVMTANGKLIAYYGDPLRLTFARSSMKPIQAIPAVESGAIERFGFSQKEIALFCASHSGEAIHTNAVMDMLQKMNLSEEHLHCGTHIPRDTEHYNKLIRSGGELSPAFSNCSGKHAGMLAACTIKNIDIDTYEELENPYQQEIIDAVAAMTDYDRDKILTGTDGCGVPVHRVPLNLLAMSFARLANPDNWKDVSNERKESLQTIRDAMTEHPEMVGGTDRFDTDLMVTYKKRIVAKGGAEGVHCFGDKETGLGVALKVEDGNGRGTSVASMEVLRQLKIGNQAIWNQLDKHAYTEIMNSRNNVVGGIVSDFKIKFL